MKLIISAFAILLIFTAYSQEPEFDWVNTLSSEEHPIGTTAYDITVDNDGNVYLAGKFSGIIDIDPGPGISNLTSNGSSDIFIQKLDSEGNFIWGNSIGGMYIDEHPRLDVDELGNVYITGVFVDTADFDPGIAEHILVSNGATDIFIQKLDTDGNLLWVKQIGGLEQDIPQDIEFNDGNIYLTGGFRVAVDFDPGVGEEILTSNGWYDIFIQKMDSDGNFIWARAVGGLDSDFSTSLTIDPLGNVIIGGFFFTNVDFDPGPETDAYTAYGLSDSFIEKFSPDGDFLWVKRIGGIHEDRIQGIDSDLGGNIYATGFFNETVDFDPGVGISNAVAVGLSDVFVNKLNPAGEFAWVRSFGGLGTDDGSAISIDSLDNIYTTGSYSSDVAIDIDPGPDTTYIESNIGYDFYIQKLDSEGDFIWGKSVAGNHADYSLAISAEDYPNVYNAGGFLGTTDFDFGPEIEEVTVEESRDGFLMKIVQCGYRIEKFVSACNTFTWDANGETYIASGQYSALFTNEAGCDSTIILNLTISELEAVVTLTDYNTLTASEIDGADYQWIDCDDGTILPEETSAIFEAIENGNYAVIVTNEAGCIDTSDCYNIKAIGLDNQDKSKQPIIITGSENGHVNINFHGVYNGITIKAYSLEGKLVNSEFFETAEQIDFKINGTKGYFILQIITVDEVFESRKIFVK